MAFYKNSSETSASLKNGEFLAIWVTISVSKTILLTGLLTVSDLRRVPFPEFYVTRNLPKSELALPHLFITLRRLYIHFFYSVSVHFNRLQTSFTSR
jgi:hypothetical protein